MLRTWLAASIVIGALGACASLTPIHYGPPDLDTTSKAAPQCPPQIYPGRAHVSGNRGTAVVAARVAPDGRVSSATLEVSAQDPDLDAASVRAAGQCRFDPTALGLTPGTQTGKTVKITIVWDLVAGIAQYDVPHVTIGVQPGLQPAVQ